MIKIIIFFILIAALICFFYMNGWIPITVKSAVMFIGGKSGKKAVFSSCNGYMKRIIKLKEECVYHFELTPKLSSGNMSVELLDNRKQVLMRVTELQRETDFKAGKGKRYTLMIHFKNATGEYELEWNKKE